MKFSRTPYLGQLCPLAPILLFPTHIFLSSFTLFIRPRNMALSLPSTFTDAVGNTEVYALLTPGGPGRRAVWQFDWNRTRFWVHVPFKERAFICQSGISFLHAAVLYCTPTVCRTTVRQVDEPTPTKHQSWGGWYIVAASERRWEGVLHQWESFKISTK